MNKKELIDSISANAALSKADADEHWMPLWSR